MGSTKAADERQRWRERAERAGEITRRMPRLRVTTRDGVPVVIDQASVVALTIEPAWAPVMMRFFAGLNQQTVFDLVAMIQDVALRPDELPARYRERLGAIADRLLADPPDETTPRMTLERR